MVIPKPPKRIRGRKRYSFSVIEEAVLNPVYSGYRGGRVEVFDRRKRDGYAILEARFLLPSEFFDAFYELWDGKESDLMPFVNWVHEPEREK